MAQFTFDFTITHINYLFIIITSFSPFIYIMAAAGVSDNIGTYVQPLPARNAVIIACEHSLAMPTGQYRAAIAFNLMPDVVNLKKNFSEVIISDVRCEARQDSLISDDSGGLRASGRIYIGVIPSGKNTDSASGTNAGVVMNVRRKQAFPLSSVTQENKVFQFDLTGFEVDVAQDPRRQQGPVAWVGNTGIAAFTKGEQFSICSLTWYFNCTCSGVAATW